MTKSLVRDGHGNVRGAGLLIQRSQGMHELEWRGAGDDWIGPQRPTASAITEKQKHRDQRQLAPDEVDGCAVGIRPERTGVTVKRFVPHNMVRKRPDAVEEEGQIVFALYAGILERKRACPP